MSKLMGIKNQMSKIKQLQEEAKKEQEPPVKLEITEIKDEPVKQNKQTKKELEKQRNSETLRKVKEEKTK